MRWPKRVVAGEAVMQVDRVGVARDAGEGRDIGFGHGLAEHRRHAGLEILEIKAVHGRERIRHFCFSPPSQILAGGALLPRCGACATVR